VPACYYSTPPKLGKPTGVEQAVFSGIIVGFAAGGERRKI